jgi:hypothetical protein
MSAGRDGQRQRWALDGIYVYDVPYIRMTVLVGFGGGIPRLPISGGSS